MVKEREWGGRGEGGQKRGEEGGKRDVECLVTKEREEREKRVQDVLRAFKVV
jgi:hypothetical protein